MDDVLAILRIIISWPVLALVVILMYKDEVRELIGRLKKAWGLEWGDSPSDKIPEEEEKEEPKSVTVHPETLKLSKSPVKLENVANIFWAGHDIMWAYDAVLRNAPVSAIVHGLKQSLHHVRELGFKDDPFEHRLAQLLQEAKETLDKDWTPPRRSLVAAELLSVRNYIGTIFNKLQRDFIPRP
jgi:hypothetical protein